MKKSFLLPLILIAALVAGCQKDHSTADPELLMPEVATQTVGAAGGGESFSFTTNTDWNIDVAYAPQSEKWCDVSPLSGKAGSPSIKIAAQANPAAASRTATLSVHAGGLTKTYTVVQSGKSVIGLDQKVFKDIPSGGKTFTVDFDSNFGIDDYNVKVMIEYKGWLSTAKTKAGNSHQISITVQPNPSAVPRTGKIFITDRQGSNLDTLTVEQLQRDVLKWTPRKIEHEYIADVVTSKLESNVGYRIEIEQQAPVWVTRLDSKASQTETLRFQLGRNETKQTRTALVIAQSADGSVRDTLTIVQEGIPEFYKDKQVITVQKATEGNVNLVIMGDGFTVDDMRFGGKYETTLRKAAEYFFDIEPYRTYKNYFNVYIVCGISNESGITGSYAHRNDEVDTKFSVYYQDVGNSTGMSCDNQTAFDYAQAAPIESVTRSLILMIANCPDYGGTTISWGDGSSIAICPTIEGVPPPSDYKGVVQHEGGGHGFGKLADEYIYSTEKIPDENAQNIREWSKYGHNANVDLTSDRTKIKWKQFYDLPQYSMVGAFEGAYQYAKGVWRPESNSCMNNNVPYYNAPSRLKMVERIMELSGKAFDMNDFIAKDAINLSSSQQSRIIQPRVGEKFIPLAPPVLIPGSPGR